MPHICSSELDGALQFRGGLRGLEWKEAQLCNDGLLRFALKRLVLECDMLPHPMAVTLWLTQRNQGDRIHTSCRVVVKIFPLSKDLSGPHGERRERDVHASHEALELYKG